MDKRPSYLIDGAVSADGYYDVRMFGGGLCGYLGSVTCIFCFPDRIIIYRMVQFFFNKSYDEFRYESLKKNNKSINYRGNLP